MNIRRKYIRDLTQRLLTDAEIFRAPVDVKYLAKLQNAVVHESDAEDKFAGYLFRDAPGGMAVIGVNSKHSTTRQRFTIAHEIGHLLLHAPASDEAVHFDEIFMRRDLVSAQGTDLREVEANLFAAELLMPEHFIMNDLRASIPNFSCEEKLIDQIAGVYHVSPQAMGIRLSNLGYL